MPETIQPSWQDWDKEYRDFQERAGVPVHAGLAIDDVRTLEVGDWDMTGGKGAFINLDGMEGTCDVQLHEIPPGAELKPQRHLHDALVFVIKGNGFTVLGSEDEFTFEWDTNAFFYLPRNTEYTLANSSDEPVKLLFQTPLPLLYSLLKDDSAIWNSEHYAELDELRRRNKDDDLYSSVVELRAGDDNLWYWESNYVPDAANIELMENYNRGGKNTNARFPFRSSAMRSHISEFPPGHYKKAHRHLCGATILLLSGEGYSHMWIEGEDKTRIDWEPYSLFVPPLGWYHQHFNTSPDHSRYLVFHSPIKGTGLKGSANPALNNRLPQNIIEYHEEDPSVREEFAKELKAKGVENRMGPELYREEPEGTRSPPEPSPSDG